MLVLNDIHLGVKRNGGTTPASREALRHYLFTAVEEMFIDTTETHVLIAGDLFDQFEIEGRDWVQTYLIFQDWLSGNPTRKLTLVAGNHDWSPKGTRVSSFEMLAKVLTEQFSPDQIHVINIDQWAPTGDCIALAHCSNQDIFEQKLGEVMEKVTTGDRVILHANYDNNFAVESDHSLNVSKEQAQAFANKGATLYFAHEHQARTELGGSVVVFGNQWPSSVSDCLNNDEKFAHVFGGSVEKVKTWGKVDEVGYTEVDWADLMLKPDFNPQGFVKVTGTASSNEAGDCLSVIAKFRARNAAFVITNGVKIEGVLDNESLPDSFEATKAFDVMSFINSNLDERQQTAVKKLTEVVR